MPQLLSKPIPQPKPQVDKKRRTRTHQSRMAEFRDRVWLREGYCDRSGVQQSYCYVCQRDVVRGCSYRPGEVHHTKSRGAHPDKKYDPDQGVILCPVCHQAATDHRIEVKR